MPRSCVSHKKLIEEFLAPGSLMDTDPVAAKELQKLLDAAPKLAELCELYSVSTVRMYLRRGIPKPLLPEMNTRIQVEHPVSNLSYWC